MANLLSTIVSGSLSVNVDSSGSSISTVNNGNGSRWYGRITTFNSTSDKSVFLGTYASVAVVGAHNNALTAWANLYVNNVDGVNGGNVYLPTNSYVANNSIIHSGNIGSQSVNYASSAGNADTVDGFHASVAASANTIPTRNANGYLIPESWIQLNGIYGLYSPTNGAHLRPNNANYGSWLMTGSRNGWQGIEFDSGSNGNVTLMVATDSRVSGFHNNSYGWQIRWDNGTLYIGKGSNGGTDATVWDSSNAPRANFGNLMYYQGFELNANTMDSNSTGFTYANNAPFYGPIARFSTGGGYDLWIGGAYTGGNAFYLRTRNGDTATLNPWREIITSGNIGSQSVSYATTAGSATTASTAGSAGSVDGLTLTSSANNLNPDNVTQNQIGYNTSVDLFGQSDGGLYSSAYSSSWIHQIYGDFRTGQIAIRGKNANTWQAWRIVLDDKNIGSYAVPYGNMTSSTGLNDNKLYLRTNGDNNHYLWNAADDWEEMVYYTGTGFRVKGSTGVVSATFTDSGLGLTGGITTTAAGGSILLKHAVSEVDAWIFQENAANWGLYWKNNPSGNHTFGGYTTVGAELFGMSAANISGNGVLTTNFVGATSAYAQYMLSNYTGYIWSASTIFAAGDMRAPIFYDSQDTGYYLDPNGISNLVQLTESTRARWNMPRIWYARNSRTADQGYWTGTNGWGTEDGTWANAWKGGFSGWDIWGTGTDHPQGAGYVHAQGIVSGQHYSNSSTGYGWMMVGSANATTNRYWLRGKWDTTTSEWTEIMTSNQNPYAWNMNQYVRTTDGPTFAQVYSNGWFRTYSTNGLYNETYGNHWYATSNATWNAAGNNGSYVEIAMRTGGHQGPIRGYFYADSSANIGILNNAGNWSLLTNSSRNTTLYGQLTVGEGIGYSSIFMSDSDEGTREIHCNSNRIGFLNSSGSWGSWCYDNGSWASAVAMYSPVFYDSDDDRYYVDPNGTSNLITANILNTYVGNAIYFNGANNYLNWTNSRIYSNVGIQSASDMLAPIFYDSNDTTYYGDFASTSYLRHLSVGDVNASNDGGWNARLNLTGSSHARLDVKSNSDGIITTMYSHTGQGVGRVGTMSNHPLAFMVNGNVAGYAYANYLQGVDSVRAPIFYDSADTTYYCDPNGYSNLYGVAIRGDVASRAGGNQIFFWGGGNTTTSAIGFKAVGGEWNEHGYTSAGYNTYFTMDSANRGWVFRRATVGGSDWTGVNVASISNTGNAQFDGLVNTPAGYISNGNPWGTSNSAFFPNGITTAGGTNWIYGTTTFIGNAPGNGAGHDFSSSGHQYSTGSITTPLFLVNNHSDNTRGYRIHNTSSASVSAMFTNSANSLVLAAGALDQVQMNKKVFISGAALGVNIAASATAGRIDASNDIVAYSTSDERFKENITPIANALDKVKTLTGVEFDWRMETKDYHGYVGHDVGVIAQQVKAVLPEAVRTNANGYLAVRYEKLIGLLIEANKELAARVEELEKKLG